MANRRLPPMLRLVSDHFGRGLALGPLRVTAAAEDQPPFPVQAEVLEEDTYLVLSATPLLGEPDADAGALARDMEHWRPPAPGSVVVRAGSPLRLLAVVHDLDREPSWRESWIVAATRAAIGEADRRRLGAIAIPPLGARFGQLEPLRFATLLARSCSGLGLRHLRRLWLICPEGEAESMCAALRRAAGLV